MLFTMQEIQALLGLLNRTPMSPAEQLFTQGFIERLVSFCQPPKEKEMVGSDKPKKDALAIADALDKIDEGVEK